MHVQGVNVSVTVHDRLNEQDARDFPDMELSKRDKVHELIGLRLFQACTQQKLDEYAIQHND